MGSLRHVVQPLLFYLPFLVFLTEKELLSCNFYLLLTNGTVQYPFYMLLTALKALSLNKSQNQNVFSTFLQL